MTGSDRPKAYSYIRMSTELQSKGDSLRRQLTASKKYAAEHGLELVAEDQLQDIGISAFKGANVADGALGKFLKAIKTGAVPPGSYLLVESLDRLSRQAPNRAMLLFLDILSAGVNIVTLINNRIFKEGSSDGTDILFSLFEMSRAHNESQTKSLRVGAAWANKRTKARTQPLTAMCPAWLRLSEDRSRYEVIEERAETIRQIFDDSASGIGNYSITQRLNRKKVPHFGKSNGWHLSYVAKILKNRATIGEYQPHMQVDGKRQPEGDAISGYFPAIVDVEKFHRVQMGLAQRRTLGAGRKGATVTNLFSQIAICAYCKAPMKFENKGKPPKGATFLICDGARRGLDCEISRWRYDEFETTFLAFVRELDPARFLNTSQDVQQGKALDDTIASMTGELAEVRHATEKVFELLIKAPDATEYLSNKLSEYELKRKNLVGLIKEKEKERETLRSLSNAISDNGEEISSLLSQLKTSKGDDLFVLRSRLSDRLKTICTTILVAPAGERPRLRKLVKKLNSENWDESRDIVEFLSRQLSEDRSGRRFFAASFRDGTMRAVFPTDNDPLSFEEQLYADADGVVRTDNSGEDHFLKSTSYLDRRADEMQNEYGSFVENAEPLRDRE